MIIYKYLKFNDAIKTLDNNSVALSNPADYNDPFDCAFTPTEEDEKECFLRIRNYYAFKEFSKIILEKKIKIPLGLRWVRLELKAFKWIMKKNPYYDKMPGFDGVIDITFKKYFEKEPKAKIEMAKQQEKFSKKIHKIIKELRESLLVSCFSKNNNSILMWSHYADKHRGVCIEFDVSSEEFQEVSYGKKRIRLDLNAITAVVLGHDYIGEKVSSDNPSIVKRIKKILYTKFIDWHYEDEVRIAFTKHNESNDIFYSEKDERFLLKMPEIKKIFAGCRIDEDNLKLLKKKYQKVEIVEMIDSANEYKVEEVK